MKWGLWGTRRGMRLGVLDVGSNSAQLQIVDVSPGAPPLPAHAIKEPTLLGEEIGPDGTAGRSGVERVAAAVTSAIRSAAQQGVDLLYPFVTSAVRDAVNRDEILDAIEAASGIRPYLLTGEQEARLIYLAAHRWYGWSAGRLLLLDIGGGSMEIVLGRDAQPELAISLPLGAGRLTRQFLTGDPPPAKRVKALGRHIRDTLGEVADRLRWEGDPRRAVATSKTFKQLARLAGAAPQRKGPFVRRTLALTDVQAWIPRLAGMSAAQREKLRGVSGPRASQILAGAIVVDETMTALDLDSVEICPWALREGIMLRHLESTADTEALPMQPLTLPATTIPPPEHQPDDAPIIALNRPARQGHVHSRPAME
jgi:exopolyphosphatase / guanosine-5'-triphosphate,3'-diphosphate pyrophosphatase